jgi:hypothetical protein
MLGGVHFIRAVPRDRALNTEGELPSVSFCSEGLQIEV